MGKAHRNCAIGKIFCIHHITGTAFITRLKSYVYIVEDTDTFQDIYSFTQFKCPHFVSLTPIVEQTCKIIWSIWPVSKRPLHIPACCMRIFLNYNQISYDSVHNLVYFHSFV